MIIILDPSINETGYAIFRKNRSLHSYGVLYGNKKCSSWMEKAYSVALKAEALRTYCNEELVAVIYEMPQIWQSARGQISKESGALEKLYYVCGIIQGMFKSRAIPIFVSEWKGQLPKSVIQEKMIAKYKLPSNVSDHETDAIGLGEYVLANSYLLENK